MGYFVYNGLDGIVGMGLLFIILAVFIGFSSVIPFVGWLVASIIAGLFITPIVLGYVGLKMTWLVIAMLVYLIVMGFITSYKVVGYILIAISKWDEDEWLKLMK